MNVNDYENISTTFSWYTCRCNQSCLLYFWNYETRQFIRSCNSHNRCMYSVVIGGKNQKSNEHIQKHRATLTTIYHNKRWMTRLCNMQTSCMHGFGRQLQCTTSSVTIVHVSYNYLYSKQHKHATG